MERTLKWQLYVAGYTSVFGTSLLFFPNQLFPYFGFAHTDEPWSRLAGMTVIVFSYFSVMIYKQKIIPMLLHSIIARTAIATLLVILALVGYPPFLYLFALIMAVGIIGSTLAYRSEISH